MGDRIHGHPERILGVAVGGVHDESRAERELEAVGGTQAEHLIADLRIGVEAGVGKLSFEFFPVLEFQHREIQLRTELVDLCGEVFLILETHQNGLQLQFFNLHHMPVGKQELFSVELDDESGSAAQRFIKALRFVPRHENVREIIRFAIDLPGRLR